MKLVGYVSLCVLLMSGCAQRVQKIDDGIIVQVNKDKTVRLQVVNDEVVRVSISPDGKFIENSLIRVKDSLTTVPSFDVTLNGDTAVQLSTAKLNAVLNKKTGEVAFMDKNGNVILQENKGGGASFSPIEVEGTKGYTMRQIWETDENESFYGLGQHQADEFNYKGKNEELFQYNTKVSIPIIISTKNYGILWDNTSLTRYGDSRDYAQMNEVFKLYNKEGKEGGITGTYEYDNQKLVRTEPFLYFENLKSNETYLPKGVPLQNAKVTFEGEVEPSETGDFRFILYYAGYIKVYINNELVVPERWRTAWNPNSYKFKVKLEAGKRIPLKIEWIPDGSASYCGLRALTPVTDAEQNKLAFWSEMGDQIDYYFMTGDNMDEVIRGYRVVTGKSQIMPKWAMGYWQSRERYKTSKELLDVLKEFREREIPIDNIVLDWSYWPVDAWGSHEFDAARFPDPQGMIDTIHQLNAKIMISVWPKFYCSTDHYKEFDKNGWIYQQAVKDSIYDWIGYMGSFYDAYSESARKLFWQQMNEHLFSLGIDAWWMDASEPNVRDCTDLEYRKSLCGPTALGPSTKYFNAYALMNAEAIYDGQRGEVDNQRVFLLTRSGFSGLQRYSTATWSGDIATRWEDMKAQISAGMNFSISGVPYWTMDIGGFCVEKRYENGQRIYDATGKENADYKEWRELNTRWYQFGAFCPLYRAHGQFPFREVWNIAPENHPAYKSIVYYTKLRYLMMPYIYTLASRTWFDDYTIMRPLVMDFNGDKAVENISDQYMFGDAFMVCPVYEYEARNRQVYLPKQCDWYDFYTGKAIKGNQLITAEAPYERMPLYVKAGSIVTFGPEIEYAAEKQDPLTLYIYAGKNASFTLYEDEGENYNYEKGKYSKIPFIYNEADNTLTIGNREGEFEGMLKERTIQIVKISAEKAVAFDLSKKPQHSVKYDGTSQVIKL